MRKLHVHLGLHFYGAGNLGDDLMVAGFLEAARPAFLEQATFTCCTPHDLACQRLRFPEIEWLPYDDGTRADCIARCDVWLGLGDTPFQATGGYTWFLDHLCQEAAWCLRADVPMYYLGVGVNESAAVGVPQLRFLVEHAERIWMRDEGSAALLNGLVRPGCVTTHADLAHLALAAMEFPAPQPGTLGVVLNFENPSQVHRDDLAALVRGADDWHALRWLAQEVRPLVGAETWLHGLLPPELRDRAPLLKPDYVGAPSTRAMLTHWEGLDAVFTSRYHGSLVGAWIGARVAVFARNDKVASAAVQLGVAAVPAMNDASVILSVLRTAQPVERSWLLDLTARARFACEEFFALASAPRTRSGQGQSSAYSSTRADFSHADRADHLAVIGEQGAKITRLHTEIDRQFQEAAEFWPKLDEALNARNLLAAQLEDSRRQFVSVEADHAVRLQVIETQGTEIARLHTEADALWPKLDATENVRNLLAAQLEDSRRQFVSVEADHAVRLQVIETQGTEIARLHTEADALWPKLDEALNARNLLAAQLEDSRRQFVSVEADHAVRLQVIETQGTEIARLHTEADALWPKLDATENVRNLLAAQLEDLRGHFERAEDDRAARLQVIEAQGAEIGRLRAEVSQWSHESSELRPRLEQTLRERDLLTAQLAETRTGLEQASQERSRLTVGLAETRTRFERSEAEGVARRETIENQEAAIAQLQAQLAATESERVALRKRKKTLDAHWTAWLLKRLRLWPLD